MQRLLKTNESSARTQRPAQGKFGSGPREGTLDHRINYSPVEVEVTKARRIIDEMGAGSGGPQTPEDLSVWLHTICDNSAASKELIRNEIKESMTGYGR